jgi:flagellar biogenesis protein FliO
MINFFLLASNEDNIDALQETVFTSEYQGAIWKTSLILVTIIVAAFLIVWIYRKYGQSRLRVANQTKSIQILERRPLSQKTMLYIVEVEGKQVLIAESQLQVATLRNLDWNQAQESKL